MDGSGEMCDSNKTDSADQAGANATDSVESVRRNEAGQLVVRISGRDEPVIDAKVARCFPWSVPESYISIRDADGKELAMLETLDELEAPSRELLEAELRDKVFNPKILDILEHKHEFGVTSITAITDRGEVIFQVRSRDDVRILSPTRALFRDADGNIYELPDLEALSPAARKHLRGYF